MGYTAVTMDANIEVSARHAHLSAADFARLFGENAELSAVRNLSVIGEFLSDKKVTLVGSKAAISNVAVLGPLRESSQIEISRTDCFTLGEKDVPLRLSGNLNGSAPIKVVGERGEVLLPQGLIVAIRHLHISAADAAKYGLKHGDIGSIKTDGPRGGTFDGVAVRISNIKIPTVHVDTDEGNAMGINGVKSVVFSHIK
jgi:putative phosphotransacetylase